MTFDGLKRLAIALVASVSLGTAAASAEEYAPLPEIAEGHETAIFAGGCFWCVEADFDKVGGVVSTTSGYIGGALERPSYKQVTYRDTGHYEAVMVVYDPSLVSYDALLTAFWHSVDPTDAGGQFCDRGESYRSAIFAVDEAQRAAAEASKAMIEAAPIPKDPIVTPILDAGVFWPAEAYHQDYYQGDGLKLSRFGVVRQSEAYKGYRKGCGRDARIRQVWGDLAFTGIPKS